MGKGVGAASPGVPQPLSGPRCRGVSSFPRYTGLGPVPWEQVTGCRPGGAPGMGMRAEEARGPPKAAWVLPSLWERFIAQPRHRHLSHGPPTAGALNLSQNTSSAGEGFRGIPGTQSSLPWRSSASPRFFLPQIRASRDPSPLEVSAAPLGRGMGESSAGATPYPPSPGGEERSSGLFPQLWGPPANFPPRTGGSRAKPHTWCSPTSGSTQSSRVPGGGVTSLSRSWPLSPAPVPVAEPLASGPGPTAAVAAAV